MQVSTRRKIEFLLHVLYVIVLDFTTIITLLNINVRLYSVFSIRFTGCMKKDKMDKFPPPVSPRRNTKNLDELVGDLINEHFSKKQASFFNNKDEINRRHFKTVSEL